MSIEIIPASPDHPGKVAADLIWTADPALMNYLFQGKENWIRVCTREWPKEDGLVAHRRAHVAIDDGIVVGILVTHDPVTLDQQFEKSAELWEQHESASMISHLEFAFTMMDCLFPHPQSDSLYVLDLAVATSCRQGGVGRRLMEVAATRAESLGKKSVRLDVAKDNPAVGFYQKIGLEIGMETRVPLLDEKFGVGPHYHMIWPL